MFSGGGNGDSLGPSSSERGEGKVVIAGNEREGETGNRLYNVGIKKNIGA